MRAYIESVAPLMKEYGAEVVVRGSDLSTILGDEKPPHIVAVLRFQDM